MRLIPSFLLLPALLGSTGCVLDRTGRSASEAWHREMAIQATRTARLDKALEDVAVRVQQLEDVTRARGQEEIYRMETVDQLRNEVARLRGDLEVLQHDSAQSSDRSGRFLEDAEYRFGYVDTRLQALEAALGLKPPATVAGPPTAGTGSEDVPEPAASAEADAPGADPTGAADEGPPADATPEALLALGEEHAAAQRWKAARAVYQRFVDLNPSHPKIDEGYYRLAETWYQEEQYQNAILAFQVVLDGWADSGWAPRSMLRQGQCFAALGQKENALLFYEDVVRLYPKSEAAKEARALKK
ncbi:MAG: tetratricopeptide repeat protein [Deltaproteobacteria bacterium]|nr:tetratricopeptide repeat protein [Deltaproteobacteria bacterium]